MNKTLGLYLHIPFCLSKCAYCDFYSLAELSEKARFVSALCRALSRAAEQTRETVDSVFFGGGTPSLLTASEMEQIFGALGHFSLSKDCEISVEVNPATASPETLSAYRTLGVNRISVGMQASTARELRLLGRRHTPQDTAQCVEQIRRAGFENFSLDLMYGLPQQNSADWQRSLDCALSFFPVHLSLYALTLSEEAALFSRRGEMPSDETQRELYHMACERLSAAGFAQYEISNFSKKGYACRHNLKYWRREDYLGFGPAASSCFQGRRYTAPPDLQAFLQEPTGLLAAIEQEPKLSDSECLEEEIMLSLRLREGVFLPKILPKLAARERFLQEVQILLDGGFCRIERETLSLTESGFFVSNEILSRLLLAAGF